MGDNAQPGDEMDGMADRRARCTAAPLTVVAVLMPGGHGATLSRNLNARQRAASFGT